MCFFERVFSCQKTRKKIILVFGKRTCLLNLQLKQIQKQTQKDLTLLLQMHHKEMFLLMKLNKTKYRIFYRFSSFNVNADYL